MLHERTERVITYTRPGGEDTISESLENSRNGLIDLPKFLQAAVEWLPIGIVLVGPSGGIVMVNREIARLLGYSSAELIGQSVDALVPDAARATHADLRLGYGQLPGARPMAAGQQVFARRKNGSEVPVDVVLTPIRIGDTPFVLASVFDSTERRRSLEAVRDADDERLRFETLVGELGAEFIRLRPEDLDGAIEDALARVVRTLDLDRSALFQLTDGGDFVHTHQWTRPGWALPPPRVSAREHFPWHVTQIRGGELVCFETLDDVPDGIDRKSLQALGIKSGVTIPVPMGGRPWGAVSFAAVRSVRSWTPALTNRLRVVATIFANALLRKQGDEAMRRALAEIACLRDRLQDENSYLRSELKTLSGAPSIVGHSPTFRRVLEQVRHVAATDSPVLLVGETGTGKTLLATRVHELSPRGARAIVRVNCASLTGAATESELLGGERRAFSDDARYVGRIELAQRSTIFFDDIADCALETQAMLVRLLRDRQIEPRGGGTPVNVDVRVIAATRKDLSQAIAAGTFRDDLYYLLNVLTIQVPPLRHRPEDIPLLVWRFVDEFSALYNIPIDAIDKASMASLQRYDWPGNARELRNVVERAMILMRGRQLHIPPSATNGGVRTSETLAAIEKQHIASTLAACDWRIGGRDGAAVRLGLSPRALESRMAKLRIARPRP